MTGGTRLGNSGFFVTPTIFTDVRPNMTIAREEIFGPVGVIVKFKTEEEGIKIANDTPYGLTGYFFTQDLTRAIRVSNALEVGSAFVSLTYRTKCMSNRILARRSTQLFSILHKFLSGVSSSLGMEKNSENMQ